MTAMTAGDARPPATAPPADDEDARWMARALALAEGGRGATSPNPMVGAVVVRDGREVGAGFHPRAGEPHAEVFALRAAGEAARGATVYVSLEPCDHHGRTPPCTGALIAAGVRRVVVGARDPNPLVAGRGLARLADAGIDVASGVLEARASRLNEAFNRWITTERPFVTLKLATSLDGRIAAGGGTSRWITGPAARARVHRLRADSDAVLVGAETALADDPQLNVRDVAGPFAPPLRVVLDSRLRVPATARAFDRALDPTGDGGALVATAAPPDGAAARALLERGVAVWSLPDDAGRVDLPALFARLGARTPSPVTSVLVEGGGVLAASLVAAGLVDKLVLHVAPIVIGGDGRPAFGPLGLTAPADAPRWRFEPPAALGDDLELIAYPAA